MLKFSVVGATPATFLYLWRASSLNSSFIGKVISRRLAFWFPFSGDAEMPSSFPITFSLNSLPHVSNGNCCAANRQGHRDMGTGNNSIVSCPHHFQLLLLHKPKTTGREENVEMISVDGVLSISSGLDTNTRVKKITIISSKVGAGRHTHWQGEKGYLYVKMVLEDEFINLKIQYSKFL